MEMVRGKSEYDNNDVLIRHDEIPAILPGTIGYTTERFSDSKWFRLSKLNYDTKRVRNMECMHEILRILGDLELFGNLHKIIYSNYKIFYAQLPKESKHRGYKILVPCTIYLTLKENYIFLNISKFRKLIDCSRPEFNRTLQEIYKNNPSLHKNFRIDEYRLKYISQTLIALATHFKFPKEFLKLSKGYLDEYYLEFKNKPDNVIVVFIYAMCRDALNGNLNTNHYQVCLFLGINSSVLSNNKELWGDNRVT